MHNSLYTDINRYTDIPIYLYTYLPIYLSTYLPIYLSTYLPIYLSTLLPTNDYYQPHSVPWQNKTTNFVLLFCRVV